MTIPITWVDAFSDVPFAGNPAAVCVTESPLSAARMQSIAFELGIAETAFVTPTDHPAAFGLRWFTPSIEVDLCGHATLAFATRSGALSASFDGDLVVLDFPADPVQSSPLPAALDGQWAGAVADTGHTPFFAFVALSSAGAVRAYQPDLAAIAATGAKALLLTAAGDAGSGADYVLRVFGPNVGIPEDPATGSAQCTAGPYWSAALGRAGDILTARQLSPRGAVLFVRAVGDRVAIAGHATTVLRGHLC